MTTQLQNICSLGLHPAQAAIAVISEALQHDGKRAVVAVADARGELLALARLDGAPIASVQVASNKAWTAARMGMSSGELGRQAREEQWDLAFFGDSRYLGWQGGLPVWHGEAVVGAVAVSGLTQAEDEAYAALGVAAIQAILCA